MSGPDPKTLVEALDIIQEYKEAYKRVMLEQCAPDEQHCTCVPTLRDALATARKRAEEAEKERDALRAQIASIERNLIGAVSLLHGGKVRITKLETDAQNKESTNET